MIDLNDLRTRPDAYKIACQKKRVNIDLDGFLALDIQYRGKRGEVEKLRAVQNQVSKELPTLKGGEKEEKLKAMKQVAADLKGLEAELTDIEKEWNRIQLLIPQIPLEIVPLGKDDSENVEIRKVGEPPKFSFKPLSHVELGEKLKLFDIERGVKIAGARNYFLVGDGARLQHAVLQLSMDRLVAKGFTLMDVPHIVKFEAMTGTGYFPGGEDQAYHLDDRDNDRYLIGTSEVSVAAFHTDETLDISELPKRYAGYSPCYRREAGAYGRDTQGLYRIHQFYKVEQVIICEADSEKSAELHKEILGNAEEVLQLLELPYRVVDVCTGDMGLGQVYKNDIESWMPSRGSYGETHSCSTLHDFQSRRLNLKYKDKEGKRQFCHTLNNTCVASPRILIPLLEVHQTEDGSVKIPKALQSYMGGKTILSKI